MIAVGMMLDIRTWRVPNSYIVLCSITAIYLLYNQMGAWGCVCFLGRFLLTVGFLFPIYLVGGLGAGDIKLFGVISALMGVRDALWLIIVSIVIGASMGVLRWIRKKQLVSKGSHLVALGKKCFIDRQISAVFQNAKQGEKIHFTVCIFIAYVGWMCKEGVF